MLSPDASVRVDHTDSPEFDGWQWVSYWYPLGQVIHFKRGVYRRALQELARELPLRQELIIPEQNNHLLME